MKCIAEVQEETPSGGSGDDGVSMSSELVGVEEETKVSFKHLMHEKVDKLPIPPALKEYLMYYRKP